MKNYLHILLPILFIPLLLLPGCDKDKPTIIKGIITDRKTGGALDGVVVRIGGTRPGEKGLTDYFSVYVQSNANGEYECIIDGDFTGLSLIKEGYVGYDGHVFKVNDGETNTINASLVPRDGFLSLSIQNLTGQYDTIYALVLSPIKIAEESDPSGYSTKKSPLTLKKNETYTEVFKVASPDEIIIVWKHEKILKDYFKKSASVVPNDTAFYTLTY